VGAGLAGLTCAYRLKQAGYTATVYEASSRIGGRCWTIRGTFADGQVAEHGGELIDQGHTEIRQLAQELGLNLDNLLAAEANGTDDFYYFDGAPYSFAQATADLKAIWPQLHSDVTAAPFPTLYNSYTQRGQQLDQMSVRGWINSATFAGTGYQNTWEVSRAQPGASGILVDYTGGTVGASFGSGTPASRAKQFLSQLEPVLPGITGQYNGKATVDYWTGYQWTRGSYSYWKVGQYTKFAGVEREPEGAAQNCHFAGEHTSIESQGYLNGGVETGERAASEIIDALG
jgi:monoamine oxidase